VWAGESYPLGATYDGAGTNFSLYSERAERVELCLIAKDGSEDRLNLDEVDGFVWHCYLPTVTPGQRYGFRGVWPVGSRRLVIAAIRASCCWTGTGSPSMATSTFDYWRQHLHPGAVLRRPGGRQ